MCRPAWRVMENAGHLPVPGRMRLRLHRERVQFGRPVCVRRPSCRPREDETGWLAGSLAGAVTVCLDCHQKLILPTKIDCCLDSC
jgi:hypothetical protein